MMKLWLREVKPMPEPVPSLDLTPKPVPCTCCALWPQLPWDEVFDLSTGIWNSVGFITSSLHTSIRGPAVCWSLASALGKQEWNKTQLLPSRCLCFSSISVSHKWLGSWILVIVLTDNSVLWIFSLRLTVEWWGLLWPLCCWLLVLHLLCLGLTTGLSGVSLTSRDWGQVKVKHQMTLRLPLRCWRSPRYSSRIICSSA